MLHTFSLFRSGGLLNLTEHFTNDIEDKNTKSVLAKGRLIDTFVLIQHLLPFLCLFTRLNNSPLIPYLSFSQRNIQ